jgi:hypothetical protein
VARVLLRLGTTAFGGPAVHIAMMEEEVVRRRRWITRERFLDLLGATNLIPGPNSTEMAIHLGYTQAGWRGLLTAPYCCCASASTPPGWSSVAPRWAWLWARDDSADRDSFAARFQAHLSAWGT